MAEKIIHPLISVPVGSVEEVRDLDPGLLKTVATCSERGENGQNMGCASWEDCDLGHKGTRPHNMAYEFFKRDGSSRQCAGHCMHIIRQRTQLEANGGLLQIIGDEGDTYTMTGTVRRHATRDTSCPKCMRNECDTHDPLTGEAAKATVEPLPPASEHKELRKYAIMREVRKRTAANQRRRVETKFFNVPPGGRDAKQEPEPERVQESRRIDGRTREGKAARAQGA